MSCGHFLWRHLFSSGKLFSIKFELDPNHVSRVLWVARWSPIRNLHSFPLPPEGTQQAATAMQNLLSATVLILTKCPVSLLRSYGHENLLGVREKVQDVFCVCAGLHI